MKNTNDFSMWRYVSSVDTEYRLDYHGSATFNLYARHDHDDDWRELDVFTCYAPNEVPPEFKSIEAFKVAQEILTDLARYIEEERHA